jgi:hypothetical protein
MAAARSVVHLGDLDRSQLKGSDEAHGLVGLDVVNQAVGAQFVSEIDGGETLDRETLTRCTS